MPWVNEILWSSSVGSASSCQSPEELNNHIGWFLVSRISVWKIFVPWSVVASADGSSDDSDNPSDDSSTSWGSRPGSVVLSDQPVERSSSCFVDWSHWDLSPRIRVDT